MKIFLISPTDRVYGSKSVNSRLIHDIKFEFYYLVMIVLIFYYFEWDELVGLIIVLNLYCVTW